MTGQPGNGRRRALFAFAYGTLTAAFFAFFFYQRGGAVAGTIDVNCFGQIARNLLAGEGFSLGYGPTIRRAPLYPLLGAAVLKLFGSDPSHYPDVVFYRPLLLLNCVLFGLTSVLLWHVARRTFGERAALVAVLLCPLVPQTLRYVGRTEVETLTSLCVAALAATGLELVLRPRARSAALFGLAAAATTLGKPVALFYPVLFLSLAAWHWHRAGGRPRATLTACLVALGCFVLPLVPWSLRNMALTGGEFKQISSNGPGEFLRGYINAQPKFYLLKQDFGGNDPSTVKWDPEANAYEEALLKAHGLTFSRADFDASGRLVYVPPPPPGVASATLEAAKDRIEGAEVKRRVLAQPLEFVGKFVVQLATFWYIAETRAKSAFVGLVALVFLGLAALGVRRAGQRGAVTWPVVAVLAYHNLIYAAFLALGRYSMPLFPTLLMLSAGGLAVIAERVLGPERPASTAADPGPHEPLRGLGE